MLNDGIIPSMEDIKIKMNKCSHMPSEFFIVTNVEHCLMIIKIDEISDIPYFHYRAALKFPPPLAAQHLKSGGVNAVKIGGAKCPYKHLFTIVTENYIVWILIKSCNNIRIC
jgi:hypothetical protein